MDAARRGVKFYQMLQCDDGHWAGDYGGPHFLMPGVAPKGSISAEAPQPRERKDNQVFFGPRFSALKKSRGGGIFFSSPVCLQCVQKKGGGFIFLGVFFLLQNT